MIGIGDERKRNINVPLPLIPIPRRPTTGTRELLQVQGRTDEAVREAEKAAQLDPVNLQNAVGYPFYTARQYDQAEKIFRRYSDHVGLGWVYTATGRYSEAITELQAEKGDRVPTEDIAGKSGAGLWAAGQEAGGGKGLGRTHTEIEKNVCVSLSHRGRISRDWVTENTRSLR